MTDWYTPSGVPLEGSSDTDDEISGEFLRIEKSLRRIDSVAGANNGLPLFVNAGASRLSAETIGSAQDKLGIVREFISYKASDEAKAEDDTVAPDSDLAVSLAAGYIYAFTFLVLVDLPLSTGINLKVSYTGDVPASSSAGAILAPVNQIIGDKEFSIGDEVAYTSGDTIWLRGSIATESTGSLRLEWAQETSSVDEVTVELGSFIRVIEVIEDV